eukprot:1150146-Pelagomonas_calceolata.AAC.2
MQASCGTLKTDVLLPPCWCADYVLLPPCRERGLRIVDVNGSDPGAILEAARGCGRFCIVAAILASNFRLGFVIEDAAAYKNDPLRLNHSKQWHLISPAIKTSKQLNKSSSKLAPFSATFIFHAILVVTWLDPLQRHSARFKGTPFHALQKPFRYPRIRFILVADHMDFPLRSDIATDIMAGLSGGGLNMTA